MEFQNTPPKNNWGLHCPPGLSFDQGKERSSLHYVTEFDDYQCGSSRTDSGSFYICPPTRGRRGRHFPGLKSAFLKHLMVQSGCRVGLQFSFMKLKE